MKFVSCITNLFLPALLIIILNAGKLPAQWVQTNGPYVGDCYCFANSENTLYAGTSDGVFMSTDFGSNWNAINKGLELTSISALVVKGQYLFAGTKSSESGYTGIVYRSSDKGMTWIDTKIPTVSSIASMIVRGTDLFVGTSANGVYRSTNNGISWTNIGCLDLNITALAVSGNYLFAGSYTSYGVYRTSDNGQNWAAINSGFSSWQNSALVVDSSQKGTTNLLAGNAQGIYKSTNNGTNWYSINSALYSFTSICIPPQSNGVTNIFAGTNSVGVYLSSNYGTSWTRVCQGLFDLNIFSLINIGPYLFAGTSNGGVYRSSNNGTTWTQIDAGFTPRSYVTCMTAYGDYLFAGTINNGMYRSIINPNNWMGINYGLGNVYISALTMNGSNVVAGTSSGYFFLSSNYGDTWVSGASPNVWTSINSLVSDGTNIYSGCSNGVYFSSNNGHDWVNRSNGMVTGYYGISLAISGTNLYAVSYGMVYLSTNKGINWTEVDSGMTVKDASSISVSGNNLYALTNNNGVYHSFANAIIWRPVNNGFPPNSHITTIASTGTIVFAGTDYHWINDVLYSGGVYLSTNNGINWIDAGDGLNKPDPTYNLITSFQVYGNNLLAGTGSRGVWSRPLSELTSVKESNQTIPHTYSLEQNYPNPFNPSTTIKFSLPYAAYVTLSIYNSMGQEVEKILSQEMRAGIHSTQWNASGYTSGVYYYRLTTDNYMETKKLLLLK